MALGYPGASGSTKACYPVMGLEGKGCHAVREEMFKRIQQNNSPGPMSCI